MKIKSIGLILLMIFVVGCSNDDNLGMNTKEYNQYSITVDLIQTKDEFVEQSENFDVEIETIKDEDGGTIYYVIIDNPKVTMMDVEAMAIVVGDDIEKSMFPSIGILEEREYNLIPSQVNASEGYMEGFILSGQTSQNNFDLKIMISWINSGSSNRMREYVQISIEAE